MRTILGFLLILTALFGSAIFTATAWAAPDEPEPADGFQLVRSAQGVRFYQKNYSNGSPDYVQVADLQAGGQVHLLHGEVVAQGSGEGVYGGDNPRLQRLSIRQFWNRFASTVEGAFCISNGQFFRLADSPTPLPFSLKVDGEILSDGYGIKEFPGQKLMLEIWPDRLEISELHQDNLYSSSAPNIVAGLTADAEKASKKAVGRTFIGIDDRDGDRIFETLLVFNTRISKPKDAEGVLRDFGADKVMMLDGGGSTQLICQDDVYIDTERFIPQAIGVSAGHLPLYAANLASNSNLPQIISGDDRLLSLTVSNRGSEAWQPGSTRIQINSSQTGFVSSLDIPGAVNPGEQVELTWQAPESEFSGLLEVNLSLTHGQDSVIVQNGQARLLLVPPELEAAVPELQGRLVEWASQPESDLEQQVGQWILDKQAQARAGIGGAGFTNQTAAQKSSTAQARSIRPLNITVKDILWIPLVMIPLMTVMLTLVRRFQNAPGF